MAAPNRSTLIYGPAKFSLAYASGTATWFNPGDGAVEIVPVVELKEQRLYGLELDKYVDDQYVTADVPVDNRLDAARIAALWPFANAQAGDPLFGDTDRAFLATDKDARIYTLPAAAVIKMPDFSLGMNGPMIGSVGILGLRSNGGLWTDGTSATTGPLIRAAASGGTFADSGLLNSSFLHQPYTFGIGTDLVDIDVIDDIKVFFNLEIGTIKTQGLGTHQKFIRSVSVATRVTPAFQAFDKILSMIPLWGATNLRGRSLDATAAAISIKGVNTGRTHFSQTKATIHTGSFRFGLQDNVLRDGEVAFVSTRQLTAGVPTALFTITA